MRTVSRKRYTDGGGLKQQLFLFASRELYADINQLIENSTFYEKFENWILHTDPDTLSSFLDGRNAFAIEILFNPEDADQVGALETA